MKSRLSELLRRSVSFELQDRLLGDTRLRRSLLLALIGFVCLQQVSFARTAIQGRLDSKYRNTLNNGGNLRVFFPLFYCQDVSPVFLDVPAKTCAELEPEIAKAGKGLPVFADQINRSTLLLYYPDAWVRWTDGTALNKLTMIGGLSLWFIVSLSALAVAFFAVRLPLLGVLTVLLCASDPFQNFEIFNPAYSNLFSVVISMGLLACAFTIMLIGLAKRRPESRFIYVIPLGLGLLLGIQYDVRLEGVGVFAGVAAAILLLPRLAVVRKVALLALFLAMGYISNSAVNAYWDGKLEKANQFVAQHHGTPATRLGSNSYSTEWWALWSGLGDYDRKYGFLVDDRAGWSYYYGVKRLPSIGLGWSLPELNKTLKPNFIATIRKDPLWFADILARRFSFVVTRNTPYRLSFGAYFVDVPVSATAVALLCLIPVAISVAVRRYEYVVGAVAVLSIGLVSLAQLGRYGLEFYSVLHLFVFAFLLCWLVELGLLARDRLESRVHPMSELPG